jgi:hypothetical protein
VGLFRRRKPLHERLLEEGGLGERPAAKPPVRDSGPVEGNWGDRDVPPGRAERSRTAGTHGLARHREWDAVATVAAPDVEGERLAFDVLPDRTVLVEQEAGEESLAPLADAIERELRPPYRAHAVRQSPDLWAVAARSIEVVRLPQRVGESLELSVRGAERTLTADGAREFGTVPELEELAASRYPEYVARAERLDEDWWEVRIDPL